MLNYTKTFFDNRKNAVPVVSFAPFSMILMVLIACILIFFPPLMTEVKIETPAMRTSPIEVFEGFKYVDIQIYADGTIGVNNMQIELDKVSDAITTLLPDTERGEITIFVHTDINAKHGRIMELIQHLNDYGYKKVSFVSAFREN